MKAGEVRRSFELNTAIVKAFQPMMMMAVEELTMDALTAALKVAASGLSAQSERLRVVSENLANAQSTGTTPGTDPYRRKTISFASELDRATGGSLGRGQLDRPRPLATSRSNSSPATRPPTTRATSRCPTSTC